MDMALKGRTAVVTGASRGIGLAIVTALIGEGMRVVAGARTVTAELTATGAVCVPADLSTPEGPVELVARAAGEVGGIDLLVNNVGGGDSGEGQLDGFLGFDDEQWTQSFDLNFLSAVRTTRAALPSLLERGGSIVNVSSAGARMPHSGPVTYTTAKAALTAFGKALSEEFGPQGVRVNTISPGVVRTSMWEDPAGYGAELAKSMGLTQEQLLAALPGSIGMTTGRLIEPAEVASLVTYLASPQAASISGTDVRIDGGTIKTA
ncbi:oxidoreductase [Actinomadura sp. 6N118]|uniref:oxidoreductase n=1 Tax=Actinomadura sp. 6N118 TaxID=3375151 RepID=UPI0037B864AB